MPKSIATQTLSRRSSQKDASMRTISVRDFGKASRCLVRHVEDLITFWVTLNTYAEATKVMYRELNTHMTSRHHLYQPTMDSTKPGRLVAVKFVNQGWLRGEIAEVRGTTCTILLGDYGITTDCPVAQLRSLPPRFHALPWQSTRIRLKGVKPRSCRPLRRTTHIAEMVMGRRKSCLVDIQQTIDGITATLMLDRLPEQPPLDVVDHWLEMGYVVPSDD